nr:retrovirus-related Pol polyprotein from transposon TNT 1-94 [Tanacetum cinerariifolium]
MHNNIITTGSRDRPPMLAPRRYPQWLSRFLRYVDTRPNGEASRKCILSSPYKPTTVLVHDVEVTDDSLAIAEHTTVETPTNMSPKNKAHFLAEKEAIHLILTGIRDDIYSTVDACQMAQEMWEAIGRLQQGQRLISSTTLARMVKQYQNEVNEICAEKLARNANPFALVATAQASQDPFYQSSRSHRSSAPSPKPSSSSRSHTATRHKGKEIAKPITPPSETASEEDIDPEQAQRDKDMQKNLALIAKYFKKIYKPTNNNLKTSSNAKNKNVDTTLRYKNDDHSGQFGTQRTVNVVAARENVGSKVVQQSGIQCINCREFGHFAKECRKPKRVKDSAYHKEKMLLYKKAEQGVPLQAEQYDWLANTDEEVDEQELEAHYSYMAKIQEVPTADSGTDLELVEQVQNNAEYNVFANELQHSEQSESNEQNDVESDDERVGLANLKLDVNENKKIQKKLKKANTTLAQELKECKAILAETSKSLRESISVRDSCLVALQTKQAEFEKSSHAENEVITDLKLREEHDIEKMLSMEKQLKFLNEVVYKRSQSIQTIHMMASKVSTYNGRPTFANPRYLKQAQYEISCLYAFPYDQNTHANRLIPAVEETLALERESRSKLNKDSVRPYDYTKLNSLYEMFKPQTQDKSRQAYNIMTNNINHFKQIVDDAWIKHSKDLFRAPTAHDMEILIQTCLMPLAIKTQNDSFKFVHELKQEMHADLKYVKTLKKEIDELESEKAEFSYMYDVILQECVSKDVMCSYLQSLSDLDALAELQCMYLHKVKECDCLAQRLLKQTEYVSKKVHTELLQRFAKIEKHSISLEIALQKCKEQVKNDTVCNEKYSNVFRKEREQYFKIQDLKAKLQDKNIAISELKKLIEKGKAKSVDTKFDKPSVVPQPNAQRILKPSVLGKPTPFSNSLDRIYFQKTRSVAKDNVSGGLSKPVTTRTLPQAAKKAATPTQAWLWHRRLSHLNFDYMNLLSKKDIMIGLPKLKYVKDQLCSSCELSKAKRSSFKSKAISSLKGRLNLLHMDLCGPMRVASINGKKYILVIVDDYSRYTWTLFLRSKDETPEVLKEFLTMI